MLLGPSGVGKSHIAQALGQRACRLGHKVLFATMHDMLKQLRAARGDGSHDRKLLRFTSPALLILDDLGLRQLAPEETLDLYDVIRLRYERGSILITSNRALEELPLIFGDPRKQHHDATHPRRSVWPPRVPGRVRGQRGGPIRDYHRISLAAPSRISLAAL